MLKIYNTKTRKLEEFKPISSRQVKVYYCGPTVYNYVHIGNLKTYTFEDMIVRGLKFLGYSLKTTMNITDIEDKIIRDSKKAGEDLKTFTEKYTREFLKDIDKLNIARADNIPLITTLIPEMIRMINTMLKRGNAYLANDASIYFKISTFKKYGELAHLDMSGMKESVRINNDEYDKENAGDFALWKSWTQEDGDNYREGVFEVKKDTIDKKYFNENIKLIEEKENSYLLKIKGRPGWHIECSACNMKYFGQQIDIHMGGEDLIFPHHQNEIAQTESCTKKEFSKYWLHGGHLMVDGKKMSKSLKNFYTLRDLEELCGSGKIKIKDKDILYRSVRMSFLNGRYRDSIDFSFSKLESISNNILSIDETVKRIKNEKIRINNLLLLKGNKDDKSFTSDIEFKKGISKEFSDYMQDIINDYIEKLEDDFNMPEVFALLFSFLKFINTGISSSSFSIEELNSLIDMLKTFDQVLGIIDFSILEKDEIIPEEIILKLEERNNAKKEKDFELSDKLRLEIENSGYKVIDDRNGARVEKI